MILEKFKTYDKRIIKRPVYRACDIINGNHPALQENGIVPEKYTKTLFHLLNGKYMKKTMLPRKEKAKKVSTSIVNTFLTMLNDDLIEEGTTFVFPRDRASIAIADITNYNSKRFRFDSITGGAAYSPSLRCCGDLFRKMGKTRYFATYRHALKKRLKEKIMIGVTYDKHINFTTHERL